MKKFAGMGWDINGLRTTLLTTLHVLMVVGGGGVGWGGGGVVPHFQMMCSEPCALPCRAIISPK